jgi:hypothetical protein
VPGLRFAEGKLHDAFANANLVKIATSVATSSGSCDMRSAMAGRHICLPESFPARSASRGRPGRVRATAMSRRAKNAGWAGTLAHWLCP